MKTLLKKEFPEVPMRWAWTMYPETIEKAVNELIREEKVKTIVIVIFFLSIHPLSNSTLFTRILRMRRQSAPRWSLPRIPAHTRLFARAYELMATDEILPAAQKRAQAHRAHPPRLS